MSEESRPVGSGAEARAAHDAAGLASALGGGRGLVETTLPSAVFLVAYLSTHRLGPSTWAAVAVAVVAAGWRIVRRESLQHALGGVLAVVVCAVAARATGRAENFYLPGLLLNAGYAAAYALSIALRYPLIGVLVGVVTGEGLRFRDDPARLRAFSRATWLWVAVFVLRLVVQVPIYLSHSVAALGVARLVMGIPLFALAALLTWRILRASPRPEPEPAA